MKLAVSEDARANDWSGEAVLSKWDMGEDFKFPKNSSQGLPYRISFVVLEKAVIPLQQCVDHGRETIQVVTAANWYR